MASFEDRDGKEWIVQLDALVATRVREECDPKFLMDDKPDDNTFLRLARDPVLLCRVIYHLCSKQRIERNYSEDDFYTKVLFDGDVIANAIKAVRTAIVSFTPPPGRQLLVALAEQEELKERTMERAAAKISDPALREEILEKIQSKIDDDFQKVLTQFQCALNSPDLLASTPEA